MPFGELWYNQQGSPYNERFKFTGKERDVETGYDYFGARYYASSLQIWLSVDPLSDKYPNISPYAYCNWNPIKYVDPNGEKIIIAPRNFIERIAQFFGISIGYVKKVERDLERLKQDDPAARERITKLEESEMEHTIQYPSKKWNSVKPLSEKDFDDHKRQGSTIYYDPDNERTKNGDKRTPRVGLMHELQHSWDIDQGNGSKEVIDGIPTMEIDAINMENKIRQKTGDKKRTSYGGQKIPANRLD